MNDFDKLTYEQQHAKEIQNSRFGWFGGSDAKMLLDVYIKRRTFATMSNTQRARFEVLMGWQQPRVGELDTPCIRGGHAFERARRGFLTALQWLLCLLIAPALLVVVFIIWIDEINTDKV